MTIQEFKKADREQFQGALLAMWFDGQGDWSEAHRVAQDVEVREGAWVHAYLHRKQGDTLNAAYWYRRAGKAVASGDLEAEWESIVAQMLATV